MMSIHKGKEIISEEWLGSSVAKKIKIIGFSIDPEDNHVTWWANTATFFVMICFFLQFMTLMTVQDSQTQFECLSVFSFYCMGMLKLFFLRVYRKRWLHLLPKMRILELKYVGRQQIPEEEYDSDDDTLDLATSVENYTDQFASTSTILSRVYMSTVSGFVLSAFAEYFFLKMTVGGSPVWPHILLSWDPFQTVVSYVTIRIMEIIVSFYIVIVHLSFDTCAAGVMIFIKGQYFILRQYCENIAGKGRKCNITTKRDRRALYRIKRSHQSSLLLLEIFEELGKLLKNIMGLYYFEVTFTLCAVAVRLKTEMLSPTEIFTLIQYLGGTLTQLFLFCYYGNAVCEASTVSLGEGPSGSAYWCVSPRVRRQLSLLAIGTTRTRRVKAGSFHFLDLPTFTTISMFFFGITCEAFPQILQRYLSEN